jgi:hypothetical protein
VIFGEGKIDGHFEAIEAAFLEIGVKCNKSKTEIFDLRAQKWCFFQFLGYEFYYAWGKTRLSIPEKKRNAFFDKLSIAFPTSKLKYVTVEALISRMHAILRGWINYYQLISRKA